MSRHAWDWIAQWRPLGKSPLGAYIRLNERMWRHLPESLTERGPLHAYGRMMHSLVLRQGNRRQYLGTFFLRNRPELQLIGRLAKGVRHDPVRLAVLGCSNGAEVYSVVWAVRSTEPGLRLVVNAVDISEEVLEAAREGAYSRGVSELVNEPIFERMTEDEIRTMFDEDGERLRIKPGLREGIVWQVGDARDPRMVEALGRQDIVVANAFLCHMEPVEAEQCLRNIAGLVAPGGHLLVSGIDLDVRAKVAGELDWKPVRDAMKDVHDGDRSLRRSWPWKYWGLEPFDGTRPDWMLRYASVFQLGGESPPPPGGRSVEAPSPPSEAPMVEGAGLIRVGRPRPLEGDRAGIVATIEVDGEGFDVWYRVSGGDIASGAETFLAATLPAAMMLGSRLEIPGNISPRLKAALPTIQTVLRSWVLESRQIPVAVEARSPSPPAPARGVASFFSGGVDSFYTLLKHRQEISTIITIHGFDVRLDDTPLRATVSRSLREAAAELGVGLIEVETNVRTFVDRYAPWAFYHGTMLASVALLLTPQIRKVYIPASASYASLVPWGTHPLLDPLWSTEEMEVVHDGVEASRLEKVTSIVSSQVVLSHLRVCFPWQNDTGGYNCGRCEKCLTTMACLRHAGALGRCTTLPAVLDLRALARIPPPDEVHRVDGQELVRGIERAGHDPALAQALRDWIAGRYYRGIRSVPWRAFRKLHRLAKDRRTRRGRPRS